MTTPALPIAPRLVVRVIEARNVGVRVNRTAPPTATDVVCQLRCGEESFKTDVKAKTLMPVWNQDVVFGGSSGGVLSETVVCRVLASDDSLLGEATLTIATLTPDLKQQHVLPLTPMGGELFVEALYEPTFVAQRRTNSGGALPSLSPMEPPVVSPAKPAPASAPATTTTTTAPPSTTTAASSESTPLPATAPAATVRTPPPNFIVVTILEAKGLLPLDGKGENATSDPFVKLSCTNNKSQKTTVIKKSLAPKWRQRFYFQRTTTSRQTLELVVEDNDPFVNDFMGQTVIDVEQWRRALGHEKQVMWIALEPPRSATNGAALTPCDLSAERNMNYGHGKVCLAIEFKYIERKLESLEQGEQDHETTATAPSSGRGGAGGSAARTSPPPSGGATGDLASVPTLESVASTESGGAGGGADEDEEDEEDTKETAEEIQQREQARRDQFTELSNVQFLTGDYQIRVRIIEVRDLVPMDVNGLCDPVVSVECLGQRQHTMVKRKQRSCVFDEYLFFQFRNLDKDTVQQGSLKITVLDADGPLATSTSSTLARLSSNTIGFFNVDLPYVYFQKDHEIHRKWVALVGSGKTNSDKIQGYLLLSIVVLGPGDKLRIHPPSEDVSDPTIDPTKTKKKGAKTDADALVLIPPRVTQTLQFLVVTIYQAQDLPDMDQSLVLKGGIDAYCRVVFAGQDTVETKKITIKGSHHLTVEWNQEVWIPVLVPTMSTQILISLWDWDLTSDQLVGNATPISFDHVVQQPRRYQTAQWTNLYGPPIGFVGESKARAGMFAHPHKASTYRGRIQLAVRMEDGAKSIHDRPHTRTLTTALPVGPTRRVVLRGAVFFGTEIPMFTSKTSWQRNSKMSLRISIGRHEIVTTRVANVQGVCHWNEAIELPDVLVPEDMTQCPDVLIHLVRQQLNETRYICYARLKAVDLLTTSTSSTVGPPTWISLIEDPAMNDLADHDFTGNVLMTLALDPSVPSKERTQQWRDHATSSLTYTQYTLLAHIFQGRGLPSADTNGLLDPYVKVSCGGADAKAKRRNGTRDPLFYETLVLDVNLPQDKSFLPKVSVQVFDYDPYDADDYVGVAQFNLSEMVHRSSTQYNKLRADGTYTPPTPRWYRIQYVQPGDTDGELLLSFELIRKDTPGIVIDPPETIRPVMEDRVVEITCLGCRGLQPVGFMPVHAPFVQFEMGEGSKAGSGSTRFTNPSSKPSGRNPNFLERILIPVKMPVDALYAPRLNIHVVDQLLGGFYKPLLGVCSVDLQTKLPFSNGKPNPAYTPSLGGALVASTNPYIEETANYSTFPGTLPTQLAEVEAVASVARSKSLHEDSETKSDEHGDKGAGIKAALAASFSNVWSTSRHVDDKDDEDDDLPEYLRGREVLDRPLEDVYLNPPPFETFPLFRGDMLVRKKLFGLGSSSEPAYRAVGRFKGLIRILHHADEPPLFDLDQFLAPQPYLIRVYVLDAMQLTPKDENNKSDPYIRLSLGDGRKRHHVINDRDAHKTATIAPKFHKMYEMKAELPGASELRLEVLDYDFFALPTIPNGISTGAMATVGTTVGGDDFIGATLLDLEDRWFSHEWQRLGVQTETYEKRKPVELRPLFAPSSTLPQGSIRLWVDILTPQEMHVCKPLDISLPPPRDFEVRVIIYRARNVTPGDFTDLSDLLVKCWLQDRTDQAQTTDTHWRARDGKASFNWRMKFHLELPLDDDREQDKGYLHLQLWDKDVLYDDCLADTVLDLGVFLKQAYRLNEVVNVFAKKKEVRIRSASSGGTPPLSYQTTTSTPPPSGSMVAISVKGGDDLRRPLLHGEMRSDDDDQHHQTTTMAVSSQSEATSQPQPPPPPRSSSKKPSQQRKEKAESLVQSVKQRLGMGDDPEDASWLTFTTRDPLTGDRVRAGELLVSVEILPVAVAQARAAGLGRSEPNNFPFLPEPADRLHLTAMWNPLYVLEALMGPKFYRAFASSVVCALIIALLVFAGPLINVFVTMLEVIPSPYGWIIFVMGLVAVGVSISCCLYRCRRAFAGATRE